MRYHFTMSIVDIYYLSLLSASRSLVRRKSPKGLLDFEWRISLSDNRGFALGTFKVSTLSPGRLSMRTRAVYEQTSGGKHSELCAESRVIRHMQKIGRTRA